MDVVGKSRWACRDEDTVGIGMGVMKQHWIDNMSYHLSIRLSTTAEDEWDQVHGDRLVREVGVGRCGVGTWRWRWT
jgi:hypothetical protein